MEDWALSRSWLETFLREGDGENGCLALTDLQTVGWNGDDDRESDCRRSGADAIKVQKARTVAGTKRR